MVQARAREYQIWCLVVKRTRPAWTLRVDPGSINPPIRRRNRICAPHSLTGLQAPLRCHRFGLTTIAMRRVRIRGATRQAGRADERAIRGQAA
jgi:hypothetical protein